MAYNLTAKAKRLLKQTTKQINLILEIEGVPIIYSSQTLSQIVRVGAEGLRIGTDWNIGGNYRPANNRDVISNKDGTTKQLTQQIQEDKSASTSVKSMAISLVDKDFQVSDDLLTDKFITQLLNKRCDIYLAIQGGTTHPEDSIAIFNGNIANVDLSAGLVKLLVQAPDNLKRQQIIPQYIGETVGAIDAITGTIVLDNTEGLKQTQSGLESYIKIDDEIIEVGNINHGTNTLTLCTRGQLNTFAATHDDEASVESMYRLQGRPLNMVLALLTSGPKINPTTVPTLRVENNTVYFSDYNIGDTQGLTIGDQFRIQGTTIGDTGLQLVTGIFVGNGESYIETDVDLGVFPALTDDTTEFFSKYRQGDYGCGIETSQIDVEQFELIETLFGAGFPDLDFYLKDDIDAREFIDALLFSIGAISLERKGRISITYTAPPLGTAETKVIGSKDIVKPEKIKSTRSTNSRFYNTVEYAYDEFTLEEKFQRKNIRLSADSFNEIAIGRKVLAIDANGFRADAGPFIEAQARRFLDRYKFGAESINIDVTFEAGFEIEVGDVVLFSPEGLRIYDYVTKSFDFRSRKMEVTNKSVDYTTGACKLQLTDTNFGQNINYCTIGPASYVDAGGDLTRIILKKLITTPDLEFETYKWTNFIGQTISIRNADYSYRELITLEQIDPVDQNSIIVSGLVAMPTEDLIVELPDFNEASDEARAFHGFISPTVNVTNFINTQSFEVDDASLMFEGCLIDIFNNDYSLFDNQLEVATIVGNAITLVDNASFSFDNTFKVGRIGFKINESFAYGYY